MVRHAAVLRDGVIIMMDKGRKKRLRWIFVVVLAAALLLGVRLSIYRPTSGPIRITISKETTHILGPVNKDGTVNYAAYLNAKHSKGVTKANNAAIPLIEIFGPDFLEKDARWKICEILKIEHPAEGGKYFISLLDYIRKTPNAKPTEDWEDLDDLGKVTTRFWNAKQYPVVAGWLEANNDALNAMPGAMQRTGHYIPAVSSGPDENTAVMLLPNLQSYMKLGDALAARAMLKLDSGNARGAWADLMAARHLARRVGSGYSLVESFVALAMETTACSTSRAMAGSGRLTGAQARAFLADMQRLAPIPDLIDTIDEGERFMMLDSVMMLARTTNQKGLGEALRNLGAEELLAGHSNVRSLEWDRILTKMNPWYDGFVAASRQKTFKDRTTALADHDHRAGKFSVRVCKPRSFLQSVMGRFGDPTEEVGNSLIALLLPSLSRALVLRDRGAAQGELSVVAMALAAYRAEKKAYPDKLSQLAPGYLKKVPDDIFVDKPFGYKRTGKGYLLHCVGENMKYDGMIKDDENDDIVVRVE